jgi:hypothetical protein
MSAIETTFPQSIDSELTNRSKILIGGTGALAPIILNLVVADPQTTFASVSVLVVLGYLLRVGVFFCIGGAMAWLHKNEKSAFKLFELGIVAPAILIGVMNGYKIQNPTLRAGNQSPAVNASVMDLIVPTAYAQEKEPEIKTYRTEKSVVSQLWQGISGNQNERVWFVVAGTYEISQLQQARGLVKRIAQSSSEYNPQIYKNDKYYAVVIGANLTLDEAKVCKGEAVKAKVPTGGEIYLYNPWSQSE